MDTNKPKSCPFRNCECNAECALYVDPAELNELVRNKLASVGVIDRGKGMCSLKNLSLCMNRLLFEGMSGFLK
jgi:hypothetical protein